MGTFSIWHLLVIAVVVLIFFGPSKIEGLGKALGRSIRGFKEGLNEIDSDVREVGHNDERRQELNSGKAISQTSAQGAGSSSAQPSSAEPSGAGNSVMANGSPDKHGSPDKRNG